MLNHLWAPLRANRRRGGRRGGWRQRLEAESSEEEAEPPRGAPSLLFSDLLVEWCDGRRSAAELQVRAARGLKDGFQHAMISQLAGVGSDQHAHSGLLSLLGAGGLAGKITSYPGEIVSDIVLPSTWIGIVHSYENEFRSRLGADRQKPRRFWRDWLAQPANIEAARDHPAIGGLSLNELVNVIPLSCHVDAAPYTKTRSCIAFSFEAVLGEGDEKLSRFPCYSLVKQPGDSYWAAWGHVIEDFVQLSTGIVGGCEVAKDAHGALWRLLYCKSDEECRCNEFGFAHFGHASHPCSECLGDRTGIPFTDLRPEALWRASEGMAFAAYKARIRQPFHPMVRSPLFCYRHFFFSMSCTWWIAMESPSSCMEVFWLTCCPMLVWGDRRAKDWSMWRLLGKATIASDRECIDFQRYS